MAAPTVDEGILSGLPPGSVILSSEPHGWTNFGRGFRVRTLRDGEERDYFVKIIEGPHAHDMAQGEFEGQVAARACLPHNVAEPISHGPLPASSAEEGAPAQPRAYFATEFRTLDPSRRPTPSELADLLARIHTAPAAGSPTGRFGFPVTTLKAHAPLENAWCDTWAEWFARQLRRDVEFEQSVRGPDPEMDRLLDRVEAVLVPRLLGTLAVSPRLCHGDLWHGNVHWDVERQDFIIFDGCFTYGHAELDLAVFHTPTYGWSPEKEYLDAYLSRVPAAEPREELEDRLTLYLLRNDLIRAGLWAHRSYYREVIKDEIRRLLGKYGEGGSGAVD